MFYLSVQLKIVNWLKMPLFHHAHLLVDLSWLTTWLIEMLKVVSAAGCVQRELTYIRILHSALHYDVVYLL